VPDPEPTDAETSPLRQWFAKRSLSQLGRAGLLIVLAVTAAFGGMDAVDDHVTTVKTGQPFDDGPFKVTVARVRLVPLVGAANKVVMPPQPGRQYLAVVATLDNVGTIPGKLSDEVELIGVKDAQWVDAMRLADGTRTYWLGPGLKDQLAFIWSVPDGAVDVGRPVAFRIWKKKFTELKVTYGRTWIESLTDYGRFDVPVSSAS
jgi:hypothetical protein